MAAPRKSTPDPTVLAAAQALAGPLREQVQAGGQTLAAELGVSVEVATAALAEVLATTVVVETLKQTARDAATESGMGKSATYQAIADLSGATRQAVSLRLSPPKN